MSIQKVTSLRGLPPTQLSAFLVVLRVAGFFAAVVPSAFGLAAARGFAVALRVVAAVVAVVVRVRGRRAGLGVPTSSTGIGSGSALGTGVVSATAATGSGAGATAAGAVSVRGAMTSAIGVSSATGATRR